jgi:transposase
VPPTKPPYPPEFKEEAVRLMRSSGKPLAQISRELDVSEQTLRNWRKSSKRSTRERAKGSPPRSERSLPG